jgi:hypothetical protein
MTDEQRKAIEWYKANLKRNRELLAGMLAAYEPPDAAAHNSLVADIRKRISLIEKILATNDPPQTP